MSRSGAIDLDWGDATYSFRLTVAQLRELDEKTGVGPGHMLAQLSSVYGNWKADWLHHTIRLGLIGGGMAAPAALALARRYVDDRPLGESLPVASAILGAAVTGIEDDTPGEPKGAPRATRARPSRSGASASQSSTPPAARRGSRRKRSVKARSGSSPAIAKAGAERTSPTTTRP